MYFFFVFLMVFFPFHNIEDNELSNEFNIQNSNVLTMDSLNNLNFNPLQVLQYDKYDDVNVDLFINNSSISSIPHSKYVTMGDNFLVDRGSFTIFSMNITSISSNLQCVQDQILSLYKTGFDVMGFSETRLDGHIAPLYTIPKYSMYCKHRNRHGGGVALYVSEKYTSSLLQDVSMCHPSLECVCVEAQRDKNTFFLASIYRPPNSNINDFIDKISTILDYISSKTYKAVYIFGDWNLNLLNQNTPHLIDFLSLMYNNSLLPMTTKPTRVTDNTASLIDHIWSNQIEKNISNYIIYTDISDHFPVVSCFREYVSPTQPTPRVLGRVFSPGNVSSFVQDVARLSWDEVLRTDCPNSAYELFHKLYSDALQANFPLKYSKQKTSTSGYYLTSGLVQSIKEKHRLSRLASKWPMTYKTKYKAYRNILTTLLRKAKNNYYKNKLKSSQGNPKETWRTINKLMGRTEQSSGNVTIHLNNITDSDTPDAFNNHFINILDNSYTNDDNEVTDNSNYFQTAANFSMFLFPCDEKEVASYINSLKSNSSGFDEITATLLKQSLTSILIPLTYIINLSFGDGIFPDKLKIAKALPIHKVGDVNEINNYRLISILPSISKIFEKAIACRLCAFLEDNNLLSKCQFGFRKKLSTQAGVLNFVSKVYTELDRKTFVASVFLDISKAFDTLNHEILLNKLNNIGVRGPVLDLLKSYLSNRKQLVYCNNSFSEYKIIKQGVPQGSILGPILFLIYINDIVNSSCNAHFTLYADDTCFTVSDPDINVLHAKLSRELNNVYKWIKVNRLMLNIKKTHVMLFQNRSLAHDLEPVKLGRNVIDRVKTTKFLGVTVDENLNWREHISNVSLTLSKITGILYCIRDNLSVESMLTLYYTLCYSKLMYCISIWGCTWPSFLNVLIRNQKSILRMIFYKRKYESTEMIFSNQKLMKLSNIHKYFLLLDIFKSLKNNSNIFSIQEHTRVTRGNQINMVCPPFRTTLFKNSIMCLGPEIWNSLPTSIKCEVNSLSLNSFKFRVKKHLLHLQEQ